ncbi:MAG: hypothetical protein WDN02_02940 [Methylovirgula sp.]|uniref:hypothetical protein n=1 Tax=Methylovirgula sp. TaxID=1978224 RepID=UPI0030766AF3
MKIGFLDIRIQRLFNDHARLEGHYGSDVADKIASRMALLSVSANLAKLPTRPPIHFRPVEGTPGLFTVDVGAAHRLQFLSVDDKPAHRRASDLGTIEEIHVIGIEDV